ncbi:transcription factor grauzone-like [Sabethes cyaneus]|uniref:transcription factor grauzone-like n=1 Tax=Sabethes cyaneus TaxID=53552 RepID=UPI00237EA618|nr:transcription factor grauzone-like [Sabethes cyaneus]
MAELTCLTCTNATEPPLSVAVKEHANVQVALGKYFWFTETETHNSFLCPGCWRKIEDFHHFYCEVERAHGHSAEYKIPTQFMVVKDEPPGGGGLVDAASAPPSVPDVLEILEPLKCETDNDDDKDGGVKSDSSDDDDDDDDYRNDDEAKSVKSEPTSEDESDRSTNAEEERKRSKKKVATRSRTKTISEDELIAERIELKCDTCLQAFSSFDELQRHSLEEHTKRASIFCCELKFCRKYRLVDHLRLHVNPDEFKCRKCPKRLPNSEALSRHEKQHQKKWHCEECNKYYSSKWALRVHNSTFHPELLVEEVKAEEEMSLEDSSTNQGGKEDSDNDCSGDNNLLVEEAPKKKRRKRNRPTKGPPRPADWAKKAQQLIAKYISLECEVCRHKFDTFEEFEQHGQSEHERKIYVYCCEYKFSRKCRLMDHLQYHENPTKYQCPVCSKQFQNSESFKRHKDLSHKEQMEKTLQCSMCPKTFAFTRSLKLHEKYHQMLSEKKWHCQSCNKSFAWETLLRHHNRIKHSAREFEHVCHICAKGYHTATSYRMHIASHDENYKREKAPEELERVQCTVCESWVFKRGLRKHMRNHTGSKTCDYCGQVCKSIVTLQYHMAQHKKADLACSVCEKTFKREISLKEHMASHTGEVLYTCDFCGKTFNSNANWSAHRKKAHPKEWLEDKMRKNPHLQLEKAPRLPPWPKPEYST